jgi:Pyridoxamine 5'-phosphate oxidase
MAFEPDALAILTGRYVGVLGTLLATGAPGLACVWYGFDGDDIIVATPAGRRKDKNVRTDPRLSAIIEDDPGGHLRRLIVRRYLDPIPPEFEQRVTAEERRIIRITPTRVRVWDFASGRR